MSFVRSIRRRLPSAVFDCFAAISGAGLSPSSHAWAATYTFTNVADTTGQYSSFRPPSINDNGAVAFLAFRDVGDVGIFTSFGAVATNTGPYAGLGTRPAINNSGTVVFFASTDAGAQGIFDGPSVTSNALVTNDGPYTNLSHPALNNAGAIAFYASRDFAGEGIFTGPDVSADAYATTDGAYSFFGNSPSINSFNKVAFLAGIDGGAGGGAGIFTGPDYIHDAVATSSGPYTTFFGGAPVINDDGTVLFNASLDAGGAGGSGLFTGPNPATDAVVTTAGPYSSFGDLPDLNNDGDVAFFATKDAGGSGIFTGPDPALDKVIATGDTLFSSSVTTLEFSRALNNDGNLAFRYFLADGREGVALAIAHDPGDADDNGFIDADDYFRIDRGYSRRATGWDNGDFNVDGIIDGDDYAIIDAAFEAQSPAAQPSGPVPEPHGSWVLALTAATALHRRRCVRANQTLQHG